MAEVGWISRCDSQRRLLLVTVIVIVTGISILGTLKSRSAVYMRDTGRHDGHHFLVFGSLHHIVEFPWNYPTAVSGDVSNFTIHDVGNRGIKKLPEALIIGAKKAGTRALLEFIRVHPNVRAAGHEVHYFDKNYGEGSEWYRDRMPTSIDGQITVEKTPSYFVNEEVPERVYNLNPDMNLIVVFKDPVDRAISDFTQSYAKHKRQHSFEESVFKHTLAVNETKSSISTGVYYKHLKRWLEYFPIHQFCFINGETLVTNPASELKKLQDFLHLKRVITEDHFYFNITKGFPCLKKREASGAPHCLGNGKGRPHPQITIEARVALYEYFKPYNARLYKIVGVNFNWESRNPALQRVID